jgi:5-methylcytosine-specific restriction protein A
LDLKHKSLIDDDEANKDDLVKKYRSKNKNQLVVELNRLLDTDRPNGSRISREERKIRDNEVINLIKAIRNFRCQICETSIRTKSGMPYVEGAHIIPKAKGGCESPSNILILCPNHHKEFDKGSLKISEHTGNRVVFTLNKKEYTISLSI